MKPFFTLAPLFGNHMVFQTGKPVKLFGTCRKRIELKVDWFGESFKYRTEGATFLIELAALPVTRTPFSFSISCRKQTVEIKDCLAGDVILCGGQSNMQFTLKETVFETRPKPNPMIRFYEVPKLLYENAHVEFPWLYHANPKWAECDKESALWFSAVGYYVSQGLEEELDVPIGVISCNNGDTSVFTWTAMQDILENPALARYANNYKAELAKYAKPDDYDKLFKERLPKLMEFWSEIEKGVAAGLSGEEANKRAYEKVGDSTLPMGPKHWNRPSGEFDTMVNKVVPFPLKAVLFYQGESGPPERRPVRTGVQDDDQVVAQSLRRRGPAVRLHAGRGVLLSRPRRARHRLHPRSAGRLHQSDRQRLHGVRRRPWGREQHPSEGQARRRAAAAWRPPRKSLPEGKNSGSPALFSHQYSEGRLVVYTQYNNLNLVSRSGQNLGFSIVFENGSEFEAEKVELTGNQIVIKNIKHAVEVRYNFKNHPHCDIYSANELPLLPFRVKLKY
ncbi:MAG: hypothetical protein MZU97_14350 [Bacillus subtilis]|nr:hypothetical protein [Bacillus subtilis]